MDNEGRWGAIKTFVIMPLILLGALWLFHESVVTASNPPVTPTPDYITTKVGTYWLSTGARVDWWLDEDRGLLCESLYESGSLACVPLPLTTYGLPAVEEP